MADIDKRQEPTSHRLAARGLELHYCDWGNPAAPPLLLLHGGEDHARSWDRVARALRRDWHIVAPDLRGHGDSGWSPDGAYMMPYLVDDLALVADHVAPGRPLTVIAHSLGAAVALHHAGVFPDRIARLVAMEGLGLSPKGSADRATQPVAPRWREWIDKRRTLAARRPRRYVSIEEAAARMLQRNPHLAADQARHLTLHGLRRDDDGSYAWKFDPIIRAWPPLSSADDELHALWHAIDCPVLLCHGAESWASNPAEDGRAAYFRNAEVVSFAGAGHWMHHDRYDAFMAELRRFLA